MSNPIVPVKVGCRLGTITNNLEDVKISVMKYCDDYRNVVVTEDTAKDGKQMLATIRKEQKALDDERKALKKEWEAPFKEFEKECKEVISLYDEPINLINAQLRELEERRIEDKKRTITSLWSDTEIPMEINGYLTLDAIYNTKWENATYKESAIRKDMDDQVAQIKLAHDTIISMNHPYENEGLSKLRSTRSLQDAISYMTTLKAQEDLIKQRDAEAEKRKKEEEKQLQERADELGRADVIDDQLEFEDIPFDGFDLPKTCQPIFEVTAFIDADRLTDFKKLLDANRYIYTVKEI